MSDIKVKKPVHIKYLGFIIDNSLMDIWIFNFYLGVLFNTLRNEVSPRFFHGA